MNQESTATALILDADSDHTRALASEIAATGFDVVVGQDIKDIQSSPTVIFLCMDLETADALEVIHESRLADVEDVILMADEDDPQRVRRMIAAGASYFFCKPFDSDFLRPLMMDIRADIAESSKRTDEHDEGSLDQFGEMRGSSPPMRRLFRVIRKVAATDTSVLLIGESGVGKELAARTLHQLSDFAEGPFITINCAAIPKELFESELFGHEKGSFSGAERKHEGFFERARGGTLFLDEITEMPLELQAKLLRVLERGMFRRVGGEHDMQTDARIVAATNQEPEVAIRNQVLREDLYYRIARFPIWLPTLRARSTDIRGLTHYFINVLNEKNNAKVTVSPAALEKIENHSWPGNVRELSSVVERAFILTDEQIDVQHLSVLDEKPIGQQLQVSVGESIEAVEKKLIFATLEAHNGDKKATAEALGMSLKTLYNRLNHYENEHRDSG